ncbi:MAG: DUF898 family protein [Proteobacteria bacterium]|nr:DUF898 family protein [Pseudomonadota bacterium]
MLADSSMRLTPSVIHGSAQHISLEQQLKVEALPVRYHGELGRLAKLFYVNLLFSLLTLGIYRFWGKTHIRRYVWSQFEVLGDRLEYLGTGRELLLGFLKTAAFVVVLIILRELLPELLDPTSLWGIAATLIGSAGFGLLFLAAQFAAQRYRLTRTSWRGIRGGMDGSAWAYAFRTGGLFVISALLAGLLIPWWRMMCLELRISASRLGTMRANLEPGRAICFWSFMLGSLLLGVANSAAGYVVIDLADKISDPRMTQALSIGLTLLSILVVLPFAFAPYVANVQHEVFNHLTLFDKHAGHLRFFSSVTAGGVFWQFFTAFVLLVPTLGLAFPVVMHRWLCFTASNLRIGGKLDAAALKQASDAIPRASEGLLEALDPGIL